MSKPLFRKNKKKTISKCCLLNFLPSMQSVNFPNIIYQILRTPCLSLLMPFQDNTRPISFSFWFPWPQNFVPSENCVPLCILIVYDIMYKCILVYSFFEFPMFVWSKGHQEFVRKNLKYKRHKRDIIKENFIMKIRQYMYFIIIQDGISICLKHW